MWFSSLFLRLSHIWQHRTCPCIWLVVNIFLLIFRSLWSVFKVFIGLRGYHGSIRAQVRTVHRPIRLSFTSCCPVPVKWIPVLLISCEGVWFPHSPAEWHVFPNNSHPGEILVSCFNLWSAYPLTQFALILRGYGDGLVPDGKGIKGQWMISVSTHHHI